MALALADRVWMLSNAVYSVISPEGCASILWKDAAQAETAAASLKLTAEDAKSLGIVEEILSEKDLGSQSFYDSLQERLCEEIRTLSMETELLEKRYERFRMIGKCRRRE